MGDHWSGLMTKQALNSRRSFYTTETIKREIEFISVQIAQAQQQPPDYFGIEQTTITFNLEVSQTTVNFFKNEMQYTTTDDPVPGQPSKRYLKTISW